MKKHFNEDVNILGDYFQRQIFKIIKLFSYTKMKSKIVLSDKFSEKEKDNNILKILTSYNGATQLGGVFMGTKNINNFPVRIFKVERSIEFGVQENFFIAYILRNKENFQVVVTDNWNNLHFYISDTILNNKKICIEFDTVKGGCKNVNKTSRLGRKMV